MRNQLNPMASVSTVLMVTLAALLSSCGQLPGDVQSYVDDDIALIKHDDFCKNGCKDFKVSKIDYFKVSEADTANGISQKMFVKISYLRMGSGDVTRMAMFAEIDKKEWTSRSAQYYFENRNGKWILTHCESAVLNCEHLTA